MARILVIDDEAQIRKMLRQMLEMEGYEVLSAKNGKEGILLNREKKADLIITDIFMPEKEGIETIIDLKKEDPAIKIIAISGGGSKGQIDYLDIARNLGAMYSLSKPVKRQELLDAIKQTLSC